MRVLQLIDSLNSGGAERVAVNYANTLTSYVEKSFLCATREEGKLKESIDENAVYFFLSKKYVFDVFAILRLKRFIKDNNINVVHAHSSSFFIAVCVKFLDKKIRLIWHDHYGNRPNEISRFSIYILKFCSYYFNHIFCVNSNLVAWSQSILKHKSVTYLPNYAVLDNIKPQTILKGDKGKRIICLANLRPDKDHLNLLKAFRLILNVFDDWTLHMVGKDYGDDYSKSIHTFIATNQLYNKVFIYGSKEDIGNILKQSDIAVLSSKSEGLPIALLEYGLASLPTVVTNVGNCNHVISNKNEGILVPSKNTNALSLAIIYYIKNIEVAINSGKKLNKKVKKEFGVNKVMRIILKIYNK